MTRIQFTFFANMALVRIFYTYVSVVTLLFGRQNAQTVGSNNTLEVHGTTTEAGIISLQEPVDIGGGIFLCRDVQSFQNATLEYHGQEFCECDDACPLYGDCCYGYEDTRSGQVEEDTVSMSCIVTDEIVLQDFLSRATRPFAGGYFMIDSCPSGYKNEDVMKDCQTGGHNWYSDPPLAFWSEYSRYLPVTDTRKNVSYKNAYCAWCNNVPIETMELWTLKTWCSLDYPPTFCDYVWTSPPHGSPRRCAVIDVKGCPSYADKVIADMCQSGYFFPILQSNTSYQNPHCVLCNAPSNFSSTIETFCADGFNDELSPISNLEKKMPLFLPFDFYSKVSRDINETTARCANGFTINKSSNECNPTEQETVIPFSEVCAFQYGSLDIFLYFSANPSNIFDEIVLQIAQHFGLDESMISQIECNSTSENVICVQLDIYAYPVDIEGFFNNTDPLYQSVSSKLAVQKLVLVHSCPDYDIDGICEDGGALPLTFHHSDIIRFPDFLVVRSIEQNRLYYNVTLAASVTSSTVDGRPETERRLHFCPKLRGTRESVELLCPFFILEPGQYSVEVINGEKYIFSDHLPQPLSEHFFLITEKNLSHVCALHGKDLKYLAVINVFLSSLSLIFLTFAFLTYCIFSFLRNGPGYLTMNFFVALFFSQLILLIGINQTQNPVVCNILAIAGHYTWLAAFLWTSIIALNVSRTFGTTMVSHRAKYSKKKLCVIMTIGWGIPALFVGICIFLRSPVVSFVNFNYGSVDGCWIKPGRVNLIIFGLPALGCLIFNLVMFVWAIRGIRRAMKGTKKVHQNKSARELLKEEIFLYIKVSILMGFSWTWAFLAGFCPDVFAFLILNTIITPLQGFFVFCIYVCNKRMASKWRTKMSEITSSEENT